ncbi:unnamed protein product [Protopolystoma xenopodis]|uniref:Uncharacterized protein n=1 Tax=Protopolystoma xenopodis TaxID=117903 RepID=A0A448XLM9_9PLAT|nr:unnamed protein product [Protopolystoma xenopodis]
MRILIRPVAASVYGNFKMAHANWSRAAPVLTALIGCRLRSVFLRRLASPRLAARIFRLAPRRLPAAQGIAAPLRLSHALSASPLDSFRLASPRIASADASESRHKSTEIPRPASGRSASLNSTHPNPRSALTCDRPAHTLSPYLAQLAWQLIRPSPVATIVWTAAFAASLADVTPARLDTRARSERGRSCQSLTKSVSSCDCLRLSELAIFFAFIHTPFGQAKLRSITVVWSVGCWGYL